MSHSKSARRLATLMRRSDAILAELYDIARENPGWGDVMRNSGMTQYRRGIEHLNDVARRMKDHDSWDAWDEAEKAASMERIRNEER